IAKESFIKLYCLEQFDILEDNIKDWEKLTNVKVDTFLKPLTGVASGKCGFTTVSI
ncbi:TPA: hypothetical protein U0067_002864, partial [Listeria monocytogenes]|nr:hypothetical protein [Listeria monocytogenes]